MPLTYGFREIRPSAPSPARIVAKKIEVTARNRVIGTPSRMNGIDLLEEGRVDVTVTRMKTTSPATIDRPRGQELRPPAPDSAGPRALAISAII